MWICREKDSIKKHLRISQTFSSRSHHKLFFGPPCKKNLNRHLVSTFILLNLYKKGRRKKIKTQKLYWLEQLLSLFILYVFYLSESARLVQKYSDGVDLNCGCPQKWAAQVINKLLFILKEIWFWMISSFSKFVICFSFFLNWIFN